MAMNFRMNNLSIRNKLRLFTLGTCLVLTSFFLGTVSQQTYSAVQTDVQEELKEELLQFNVAEQNRLRENLLAGKDVAETSPAIDILNSREPKALYDWGKTVVGHSGLSSKHRTSGDQPAPIDLVSLVYPDGNSLGFVISKGKSIVCEPRRGERPFPPLDNRIKAELADWEAHDGNLYELVQQPLNDTAGHEVGTLVIGFQIDDRLADRIAGKDERAVRSSSQTPIKQDLQVVLWHMDEPDPQTGVAPPHILALSQGGVDGDSVVTKASLLDLFASRIKKDPFDPFNFLWKEYRFQTEGFGAPGASSTTSTVLFDNREDVKITVIQDTRPKQSVFHRLAWILVLLGALGMLLGVFVGTYLSKPIANPLVELAEVAESVAQGDLDQVHVLLIDNKRLKATDEIGVLERSFVRMVRGLKERLAMSTFLSQATYDHICSDALDGAGANAAVRTSLAVMFSDIRGFTNFSENEQPEDVIALLNEVLSIQAEIVERHGGDINKFIGDAVFAWFAGDDRCDHAVAAAAEIVTTLDARFGRRPGTQVGIGIHLGELVVGAVGSPDRKDYTAIGDVVNRTARLCSKAEAGQILLSAEAAAEYSKRDQLTSLEPILLKGITRPVPIFAVNHTSAPVASSSPTAP